METIQFPGNYTWKLLLEVDNSNGPEYSIPKLMKTSYRINGNIRPLVQQQATIMTTDKAKAQRFNECRKWDIVSIAPTSPISDFNDYISLIHKLNRSLKSGQVTEYEKIYEEIIVIPKGRKVRVYQLVYSSWGIEAVLPMISMDESVCQTSYHQIAYTIFITPPIKATKAALFEGKKYNFKTTHGTYLRANPDGKVDCAMHAKEWESWEVVILPNGTFSVWSSAHSTSLCVEPVGPNLYKLVCRRQAHPTAFDIVKCGNLLFPKIVFVTDENLLIKAYPNDYGVVELTPGDYLKPLKEMEFSFQSR